MTTNLQKKLSRKNRGQGMTEYIIIVALIAIAAVGIITIFGNNFCNVACTGGVAATLTASPFIARRAVPSTTTDRIALAKNTARSGAIIGFGAAVRGLLRGRRVR